MAVLGKKANTQICTENQGLYNHCAYILYSIWYKSVLDNKQTVNTEMNVIHPSRQFLKIQCYIEAKYQTNIVSLFIPHWPQFHSSFKSVTRYVFV